MADGVSGVGILGDDMSTRGVWVVAASVGVCEGLAVVGCISKQQQSNGCGVRKGANHGTGGLHVPLI